MPSEPEDIVGSTIDQVLDSGELLDPQIYPWGIAYHPNRMVAALRHLKEVGPGTSMYSSHADHWKRAFTWLDTFWKRNTKDYRFAVSRVFEDISMEIDMAGAEQTGFFEAFQRLVETGSWSDIQSLVYGTFGSFGKNNVKARLGSIIIASAQSDTSLWKSLSLICRDHIGDGLYKSWVTAIRTRMPAAEREYVAIAELNDNSGHVPLATVAAAFTELAGDCQSERGQAYLSALESGLRPFEARQAAAKFPAPDFS